ncbi:hypothetical protein [Roseimarinus sediminis]|uniref:hypothetical protein n=1 Tax=Roseimarinus sediminis TaxID=1610899 RepID=UPI003D24ACE2
MYYQEYGRRDGKPGLLNYHNQSFKIMQQMHPGELRPMINKNHPMAAGANHLTGWIN